MPHYGTSGISLLVIFILFILSKFHCRISLPGYYYFECATLIWQIYNKLPSFWAWLWSMIILLEKQKGWYHFERDYTDLIAIQYNYDNNLLTNMMNKTLSVLSTLSKDKINQIITYYFLGLFFSRLYIYIYIYIYTYIYMVCIEITLPCSIVFYEIIYYWQITIAFFPWILALYVISQSTFSPFDISLPWTKYHGISETWNGCMLM